MTISLKKGYVLFEQGIISLLNFSLIFILSKLIKPDLFKEFFLGYSVVVILSLIASSFANQPLQLFLNKNENNVHYILKALVLNIIILIIASTISYIIINIYFKFLTNSFPHIFLLGLSISIFDTLRRVSFVYFQENFLVNAFASFSIFLSFFFLVSTQYYTSKAITVNEVYFFLIISYAIGIFNFLMFGIKKIKRLLELPKSKNFVSFFELLRKHSNYAFWLVLGIILFWIYTQGIYFLAEQHVSIDDFNAVRISQNLVGILSIVFVTFENIMLTKTAVVFNEKKYIKLNTYVRAVFKKNLLPFTGIVLLVALFTTIVFKIYFQNNAFYSEKAIYLAYFFTYQFIFGLSRIFVVALKAMNQTKYVFYNHLITCLITVIIGLYFLPQFNNGHALAIIMLISLLVFTIGIFFSYKKVIFKHRFNEG